MEGFKIVFKGLPFTPEMNQVIFVENGYHQLANKVMRSHYSSLKSGFELYGHDFIYLPMIYEDEAFCKQMLYYAPYLKLEALRKDGLSSGLLLDYMVHPENREMIKPALLFNAQEEGDEWVFCGLFLDDEILKTSDIGEQLPKLVMLEIAIKNDDGIRYRIGSDEEISPSMAAEDSESCYKKTSEAEKHRRKLEADAEKGWFEDIFKNLNVDVSYNECFQDEETEDVDDILRDLERTIRALRAKGISLMAIHELIDKQEPLSRMVITNDFRIFLPEYGNLEVEMGELPKALYFFFLRYPEGIPFSYLPDHATELLNIYRQLRPGTAESRLQETINKLVDPLENRINENIARIRQAFVKKFDIHLARNYYVHGKAGENYGISLDRDLVSWED